MISPESTIAFIGTGVMGTSMARHLMDAGYKLVVFNRTMEHAEPLLDAGASWADTPGEAASGASAVITIVGTPDDVEEIYMGDDGIIDGAAAGTYLIDCTTSSPKLAREIYAIAAINDLHVLDAPVTGGARGAQEGTLTFFVGGEEDDLSEVSPLLEVMGSKIAYQGEAGHGQLAKLANQIAYAGSLLGVVESLAFARQSGLDEQHVLDAIRTGTASSWAMDNIAPSMLKEDFDAQFAVKHFVKDLGIALSVADSLDITLPGLETAYQLYDLLSSVGGDEMGVQALTLLYEGEEECEEHGLDWEMIGDEGYDEFEGDDDEGYDDDGNPIGKRRRHGTDESGYDGGVIGSFFSPN